MYTITKNEFNIDPSRLFVVGKRENNRKRSFLFISKLLGKHLAVRPEVVKSAGYLLASLKYRFPNTSFIQCIENGALPDYNYHATSEGILVIGFCETATGLGMAVGSAIEGSTYITTTREPISMMPRLLTFEESHSLASTHSMFSDTVKLSDYSFITLVDDEITTGNSLLHLMNAIVCCSPVKEFNIMTVLDWRGKEQRELFVEFEQEHAVKVNVYSLIEGEIADEKVVVYQNGEIPNITAYIEAKPLHVLERRVIQTTYGGEESYFCNSGRFGVKYADIQDLEEKCKIIAHCIEEDVKGLRSLLVLGHGENIYIPSRVAAALQHDGFDVMFKTTSRTPIYCDGNIIKDAETFEDRGTVYHFYNRKGAELADKVILLTETPLNIKLTNNISIYQL